MELKTPRDVMQALLDGKRVKGAYYSEYFHLSDDGWIVDSNGGTREFELHSYRNGTCLHPDDCEDVCVDKFVYDTIMDDVYEKHKTVPKPLLELSENDIKLHIDILRHKALESEERIATLETQMSRAFDYDIENNERIASLEKSNECCRKTIAGFYERFERLEKLESTEHITDKDYKVEKKSGLTCREALKYHSEGHTIARKDYIRKLLPCLHAGCSSELIWELSNEDLWADDWEVVE